MRDALRVELEQYSARWGNDPELVQGAGGNTSVKLGDRLLVKASGLRLADAARNDVFVNVDLAAARAMADGGPMPSTDSGLRPSIETSFHAVLPHRFVVHLHSVDVIAFAVRTDGAKALAPLLAGLNWGWVPYRKPGAALAREVAALCARGPLDVVVLANHGLIVGADSCRDTDALVCDVRNRLQPQLRGTPGNEQALRRLGEPLGLEPVRIASAHLAATNPVSLAFATAGTLYPDHAVFLGRGAAVLDLDGNAADENSGSLLRLVPGIGALLPTGAPREAHEMAGCLGAVAGRIATGACVTSLSRDEESELLQWDAEQYRQALARGDAVIR